MSRELKDASPGRLARKDRLIQQFEPLVHRLVGQVLRIGPWHPDYDDAVGCGMLAVTRAAEKYDHTKGVKFITYAWRVVVREMLDFNQKWRKNGFTSVGDHVISSSSTCRIERVWANLNHLVGDWGVADPDDGEGSTDRAAVRNALRFLSDRDRRVIVMRYWEGMTQREVSDLLKISKARVGQIEYRALIMLRRQVKDVVTAFAEGS